MEFCYGYDTSQFQLVKLESLENCSNYIMPSIVAMSPKEDGTMVCACDVVQLKCGVFETISPRRNKNALPATLLYTEYKVDNISKNYIMCKNKDGEYIPKYEPGSLNLDPKENFYVVQLVCGKPNCGNYRYGKNEEERDNSCSEVLGNN